MKKLEAMERDNPHLVAPTLEKAYKEVFDTENGQLVLHDLATQFFLFQPTYDGDNPTNTFVSEGQRNVLLYILQKRRMDVHALLQLAQEV